MTLTRWTRPGASYWTPFRQLNTLREEIDRLFESPLASLTTGTQQLLSGWLPAVDIHEDNDNFYVKAELPGMNKDDIDISLHDGTLTISGERKEEKRHQSSEALRSERFLGRFQRTFGLPTHVKADNVKANYTDGILTVTLPKAEEAKPKQIEVNIS
jgi:HSP20 family protein